MRNYIQRIILTAVTVLVWATAFTSPVPSAVPVAVADETAYRVKVTFSFTIARNRDCGGFGICDISLTVGNKTANSATGTIYADEYNRNLMIIEVNKATGISPASYDKYFRSGSFLMEDDVPLPGDMIKELGLAGSRTLVAGKHKITEKSGIIYISIPVK